MGRPLAFDYDVKLGPRERRVSDPGAALRPGRGRYGPYSPCASIWRIRERLMTAIDREKPLSGERLNAVLSWQRKPSAAGCYCEAASRDHKWGLVLETIHYALAQKESVQDTETS